MGNSRGSLGSRSVFVCLLGGLGALACSSDEAGTAPVGDGGGAAPSAGQGGGGASAGGNTSTGGSNGGGGSTSTGGRSGGGGTGGASGGAGAGGSVGACTSSTDCGASEDCCVTLSTDNGALDSISTECSTTCEVRSGSTGSGVIIHSVPCAARADCAGVLNEFGVPYPRCCSMPGSTLGVCVSDTNASDFTDAGGTCR